MDGSAAKDAITPGPRPQTAEELKAEIEAGRSGRPFLSYRDGEGELRLVVIDDQTTEIWIGRGEQADLRVAWDKAASQLHAQVLVVRGACTLVDEGLSTNGSWVNGERVSGRRRLRDGDVVRVGRTDLRFRSSADAGAETTLSAPDAVPAVVRASPAQRRVLVELCRPFKEGAAFATPATNGEIAERLHLSVDAVKTHLRALFEKFELTELPQNQKRVALVERALQTGLIGERDL